MVESPEGVEGLDLIKDVELGLDLQGGVEEVEDLVDPGVVGREWSVRGE